MGSYENIVKIEAMRRRVEEGDQQSALKILNTMAIKKIKNMSDLSLIAEVYAENERYEEAAQLYHKIYEKTKTRKALYQLVDLSIRTNNLEDAQYYLVEYQKAAPKDFYKYIFRYKIEKLKGASYEKLIEILETLKATEYIEKWAYELAKTYYKAGMEKECIKECSDIILWFGEGPYVEKAKILKSYFSGETDRDRIMEELKQRASEYSEKAAEETAQEGDTNEEGNIQEPDIMDIASDTIDPEPYEAQENASADAEEDTCEFEVAGIEAVGDTVWQEDENTIYKLLAEEDMKEYDSRLNAIAEELNLNMEEIFGSFLHNNDVRKQLAESLEAILKEESDDEPVKLIITGAAGSGKTTLAKDITMFLFETGILKSSRIAKIDAQKLNTIDLLSKTNTLRDCCLVIEHASEMLVPAINSLLELCDSLQGNIAVIFEEAPENIVKLFANDPKLMDLFKNRIHLT